MTHSMIKQPTNQLIVVAPDQVSDGFRLAGAHTIAAHDPATTTAAVQAATAEYGAAVVAVHHSLWRGLPADTRETWEQRLDVLVLPLPPDDGETTRERHDQLRDLLAAAVGYEISFVPQEGNR